LAAKRRARGRVEVTVIDRNDAFVFGYSKLDLMFRGASRESVRLPYSAKR
jgi:sulfide:quinone oxidoreductase